VKSYDMPHTTLCFTGFRYFLAANSVALCYFLGPKKSTAVALNSALLCAGGKFVQVLFTTAKEKVPSCHCCIHGCLNPLKCCEASADSWQMTYSVHLQYPEDKQELGSIWDYDPPSDMAGSGAWVVLRELATTMNRWTFNFSSTRCCILDFHRILLNYT
jgi:hypothetical protein